jgi:23S rRNA (cytosine1962-C5)-methyltransferase
VATDSDTSVTPSPYALLDAGGGERLEQWGPYRLRRPDARAIFMRRSLPASAWDRVDAHYQGEAGRGRWARLTAVPERWPITHAGLTLIVKLAPYKHTGVFPEQADHWKWMTRTAAKHTSHIAIATSASRPPLSVLNLFAYTGGATMALARAGHHVTHVDASKPALAWARENATANNLPADAIRWIQDDAATFVKRELRRGRRYNAAIMDPPAFGRTPEGRIWRLADHLGSLLADVISLLEEPAFLLINDYSRDADPATLEQSVESALGPALTSGNAVRKRAARLESGHLRLQTADGRWLDTGSFVRWHARD